MGSGPFPSLWTLTVAAAAAFALWLQATPRTPPANNYLTRTAIHASHQHQVSVFTAMGPRASDNEQGWESLFYTFYPHKTLNKQKSLCYRNPSIISLESSDNDKAALCSTHWVTPLNFPNNFSTFLLPS